MPNMLMMRYAGSRGNENRNEMRQGGNRNEMAYGMGGEMRGGNRNEMRGEMDGGMRNEMRRGNQEGYNRGNYDEMENRNEYAESRYRGRDGRWRSGRRRSEYEGGSMMDDEWPEERQQRGEMRQYDRRRSGGDEEEEKEYEVKIKPSNVVEWPYAQPEERQNRMGRRIGFGAENTMSHGSGMQEYEMGKGEMMEMDRETAEKWVRNMRNEDKSHPVGGKWSEDMLKPLAQKYGLPTDGERFWEFYAMTNAMYSDYGEVARKFGITSPEFYACMAKAWLDDKDAEPGKTMLYYEYIVKK